MLSTLKIKRVGSHLHIIICTAFLVCIFWHHSANGIIRGVCSDCHTMHNSQNNSPMNYDSSDTPNNSLTRDTCLGCHAQGGPSPTVVVGSSIVPQVMHSSDTHLAGGNFGYITGMAGSLVAADNKGHNLAELTGTDSVHWGPPGSIRSGPGHAIGTMVNTDVLTCAGGNGCHGYRAYGPGGEGYYGGKKGITSAHHNNVDGQLDQATDPANSYRFLMGVKGFESSDWQENASIGNHNEYFALPEPIQLGCSVTWCHKGPGGMAQPPDGTMSQFCATCHGNFHTLANGTSDGVGITASSPFIRHPTDLSLPARGEYLDYTTYNLDAPVARLNVPAASSGTVTPGSDAVMCLSCHLSHASDYPSMLRWDYSTMIAGNAGAAAGTGCFVCHSHKD